MSAETLTEALAHYWPLPVKRVAERILADPEPLLAALAEAGVLVEVTERALCSTVEQVFYVSGMFEQEAKP